MKSASKVPNQQPFQRSCVGILGGMGPMAGLMLSELLVNQESGKPDQESIPFILFSLPRHLPDRTDYLLGKVNPNPGIEIAAQFRQLCALGATDIAMACNTAHTPRIIAPVLEVAQAFPEVRFHQLPDTAANHIASHTSIKKVGILGTTGSRRFELYTAPLEKQGLEAIYPHPPVQDQLHQSIYHPDWGIKATKIPTDRSTQTVRQIIAGMQDEGVQGFILGCTELSLIFEREEAKALSLIDPLLIMAQTLVRNFHT